MFFVVYEGDLEKDPLDKGCECFTSYTIAFDFGRCMQAQGYKVKFYQGQERHLL